MNISLLHVLKSSGIRILNTNYFKIPLNSIFCKRQICLLPPLQLQKPEDSTKKPKDPIKITLISFNNSISVVSLEDAKNISKRRDLELVKVVDLDRKTQRPVYKLVSKSELLSQEIAELDGGTEDKKKASAVKKDAKNLTIGSKITDHDLSPRIKNISKWLIKGYEVRILIQGSSNDATSAESIFNKMETAVKENNSGRIIQKRVKGGNIKFSILPTKQTDSS